MLSHVEATVWLGHNSHASVGFLVTVTGHVLMQVGSVLFQSVVAVVRCSHQLF